MRDTTFFKNVRFLFDQSRVKIKTKKQIVSEVQSKVFVQSQPTYPS